MKVAAPKFVLQNAKNDGDFNVQFYITNLAFKMLERVSKMSKWQTNCLILMATKAAFKCQNL